MRVTFPDGTVIWHRAAIDTFIDALRKIGLERIPEVGILHGNGFNLVSKAVTFSRDAYIFSRDAYIFSRAAATFFSEAYFQFA